MNDIKKNSPRYQETMLFVVYTTRQVLVLLLLLVFFFFAIVFLKSLHHIISVIIRCYGKCFTLNYLKSLLVFANHISEIS